MEVIVKNNGRIDVNYPEMDQVFNKPIKNVKKWMRFVRFCNWRFRVLKKGDLTPEEIEVIINKF